MTRARQTGARGPRISSSAGLDCAAAFQKIAFDCVARVRANHGDAIAGDPEAVHQMRVALTRLRAAVLFFEPVAVDTKWRYLKQEVAWLNGWLGAARDSDVMVEHSRRQRYKAWADGAIGADLDRRQARDHRQVVRCLRSARTRRLIEALSVWTRRGPWLLRWEARAGRGNVEPLQAYCERELDLWRKRLIRNGRHLSTLNGARRHRLRIRAKRFRYMLEALTDVVAMWSRAEFRYIHGAAKRLQRTLGDLRDFKRFADLSRSVSKQGKGRPPGYRRQRDKLKSAALGAWRDLKRASAR